MKRKKRKDKSQTNNKKNIVEGTVYLSPFGYAFLSIQNQRKDYLIPAQFLGKAIDRDFVRAELIPDRRKQNSFIAKVIEIVERKRKKICGVILNGGRINPLSKRIFLDFYAKSNLAISNLAIKKKGYWVETEFPSQKKSSVKILKIIGPLENIQADLSAIRSEYELPDDYSEKEERLSEKIIPVEIKRHPVTDEYIITIDPQDAKDFDDAISVKVMSNGNYELSIHIADVACFVPRGGKFDREAYERGFSSYLPGKTIPMLPKTLTRRISLNPGCKSLTHSIFIEIDRYDGSIVKSRRQHTIIEVNRRLTFDDLQYFIEKNKLPPKFNNVPEKEQLMETLQNAVNIYKLMREKRKSEENFLEIDTEFVRAICDEGGNEIKMLKSEKQRDAEKLVEEFMLAANSEVAKEMQEKSIPGIYRIHSPPSPEKAIDFVDFVKNICNFNPGDICLRKNCINFLYKIPEDHRKGILIEAFLRTMARAYYSESPDLHFGLGKTLYTHFTSPIRRYPDLVIHQQFLIFDLDQDKKKLRDKKEIAAIAIHSSDKEILNDEAFWTANDLLKLHYLKKFMKKNENEYFEAVISKIAKNSIFIHIPLFGIRGEIPFTYLNIHKKKHSNTTNLISGKKHYKPGNFIVVSPVSIDLVKRQAVFKPF